jgi:hypothetical protein
MLLLLAVLVFLIYSKILKGSFIFDDGYLVPFWQGGAGEMSEHFR